MSTAVLPSLYSLAGFSLNGLYSIVSNMHNINLTDMYSTHWHVNISLYESLFEHGNNKITTLLFEANDILGPHLLK